MNNNYITVTEVNKYIKEIINDDLLLKKVYLKGEISNFKAHSRGHFYFTLKDENSRLAAVMFRATASKVGTNFKDGDMVNAIGKISVYEGSGTYQIYIESMELSGSGDLYKKFLELKEKLFKQGWFDLDKKKPIPKFPKRIGVVTASTGAAIRDIITTIRRRYPLCEIILFPSLVQGNTAKDDIVNKIKLSCNYDIDTLIVGRGGGSIEDLWAYNEEIVAKAIYECPIPVISAVGHEIDFTIADYVADKRAATPTAAAEIAVPNIEDVMLTIDSYCNRITNSVNNKIDNYKKEVLKLKNSSVLLNPINMYNIKSQNLNIEKIKLVKCFNDILSYKRINLFECKNSYLLQNPRLIYENKINKLDIDINKLELLNPLNSLKRGYGIVKKEGKCIEDIKNIKNNDKIDIYLKNGIINANVLSIKED